MHFCYVDESGNAQTYDPDDQSSTPVFIVVGVSVASRVQKSLTMDFVRLKQEFEPHLQRSGIQLSDIIKHEMKGAKLRRDIRGDRGGRNQRRRAMRFLDRTLDLLEKHNCRLMGKVHVKVKHAPMYADKIYPRAIAEMATTFNSQLASGRTDGIMILDAQTKVKNEGNVHTITTRRFKAGGDVYPHLIEAPVFGHSDTHIPLQIADLVASALIFPSACVTYCEEVADSPHIHPRYADVREQFGARVARLEHRYVDAHGDMRGGFQVIDPLNQKPTHLLFRD